MLTLVFVASLAVFWMRNYTSYTLALICPENSCLSSFHKRPMENKYSKYPPVVLENVSKDTVIDSPFVIKGRAVGNWFFEASFTIVLVDWDGKIISEAVAEADGDWMTADYVEFTAKLNFKKPEYGNNGTLIFRKDNPSGLPQHDDSLEIPVLFKQGP